jgi:hypothetical protein
MTLEYLEPFKRHDRVVERFDDLIHEHLLAGSFKGKQLRWLFEWAAMEIHRARKP